MYAKYVSQPSPNRSMLFLLLGIMALIYIWVTKEDAVSNQYGSCSSLGVSSPSIHVLILSSSGLVGSTAASGLAKAGHRVYVLLGNDNEMTSAEHNNNNNNKMHSYTSQEITAVSLPQSSTTHPALNLTALTSYIAQHDITTIIDSDQTFSPAASMAIAKSMLRLARQTAVKRTYVYISGCMSNMLSPTYASSFLADASSPTSAEPSHSAASPTLATVESALSALGSSEGRSRGGTPLHTIILRPGVLYGAQAWRQKELRTLITSDKAMDPNKLSPQLASSPFLGLHINDLSNAIVALLSNTHVSALNDLSGSAYDLRDESRLNVGTVGALLRGEITPAHLHDRPLSVSDPSAIDDDTRRRRSELTSESGGEPLNVLLHAERPAVAGDGAQGTFRLVCTPSRASMERFQSVTRWTPRFGNIDDPQRLEAYQNAVRLLSATERTAPTVHDNAHRMKGKAQPQNAPRRRLFRALV